MKEKNSNDYISRRKDDNPGKNKLEGYPPYPPEEDIYGKYQKDRKIDPEDPSNTKELIINNKTGKNNEKDFYDDISGSDLDVPGSELDNDLEIIGSEDEENNYYSLGGDDHNDLEEDYLE
jgi:hypothetical protein